MSNFPKVLILEAHSFILAVQRNKRYSLWMGRKDGKVSYFALSPYDDAYTLGSLVLKVDAEFVKTSVVVDVYNPVYFSTDSVIAQFWSLIHDYAYNESQLDGFINNDTLQSWTQALGVPVTFYPFGGPADKPERYPCFERRSLAVATSKKKKREKVASKLSLREYLSF